MHVWPNYCLLAQLWRGGGLGRKGTGGWVPGKKETRGVWQMGKGGAAGSRRHRNKDYNIA